MDVNELQKQFEESSIKVIADLQRKLEKLTDENKSLLLMLEGSVPLVQNNLNIGISNERLICETQIARLKNKAVGADELTMEDARKLQIYVDVLEKLSAKKDDGINAALHDESELLRLVKDETSK